MKPKAKVFLIFNHFCYLTLLTCYLLLNMGRTKPPSKEGNAAKSAQGSGSQVQKKIARTKYPKEGNGPKAAQGSGSQVQKKIRKKAKKETFSSYIYKILKQVHHDSGKHISSLTLSFIPHRYFLQSYVSHELLRQ